MSVWLSWYLYRCVVSVSVMRILLFVLHVCMLRECERVTEMLVWEMEEVCLWSMQGIWVVHMVQVLCLAQLTC